MLSTITGWRELREARALLANDVRAGGIGFVQVLRDHLRRTGGSANQLYIGAIGGIDVITDYSEMIRHESSAAHLAQCTQTLLEALSEARGFVVHGELGTPLVETLRFANDLLDVISDSINTSRYDPAAASAVEYLAGQVKILRTFARPIDGSH